MLHCGTGILRGTVFVEVSALQRSIRMARQTRVSAFVKKANGAPRPGQTIDSVIPGRALSGPCAYFIVGMTNSEPCLVPEGQRAVTVLVLV